jgi:hypothetical protein
MLLEETTIASSNTVITFHGFRQSRKLSSILFSRVIDNPYGEFRLRENDKRDGNFSIGLFNIYLVELNVRQRPRLFSGKTVTDQAKKQDGKEQFHTEAF